MTKSYRNGHPTGRLVWHQPAFTLINAQRRRIERDVAQVAARLQPDATRRHAEPAAIVQPGPPVRRPRGIGCNHHPACIAGQPEQAAVGIARDRRQPDRRLARAHVLLSTSGGAGGVAEIGASCGFRNESAFSRAFHRAYGYTAREAVLRDPTAARYQGGHAEASQAEQALEWVRALCR